MLAHDDDEKMGSFHLDRIVCVCVCVIFKLSNNGQRIKSTLSPPTIENGIGNAQHESTQSIC